LSSTSTNKTPVFIDRPLYDSVRVTTQIAGNATNNTLFVQGGQVPAILVDMDATLSEDNNSGGVVDSITIIRNDYYRDADYVVADTTSGTVVALSSGQVVLVFEPTILDTPSSDGFGYYTYTGSTTLTGINTSLVYSGGTSSGFVYNGVNYGYQPEVTFVVYHTRGTTNPVPAQGDYQIVFVKQVPANTQKVDCSDVMPELGAPVMSAGNTAGLGPTAPLRNKGILLERGDRLYVGVFPDGPHISGYTPGAHVIAQGGFY
jgi:hypothetical protein